MIQCLHLFSFKRLGWNCLCSWDLNNLFTNPRALLRPVFCCEKNICRNLQAVPTKKAAGEQIQFNVFSSFNLYLPYSFANRERLQSLKIDLYGYQQSMARIDCLVKTLSIKPNG